MYESNKEQEERLHLIREYKLSELILIKKKDELEKENNKFKQLNNRFNTLKKISRFQEEIKNLTLINEQIEKDNKLKTKNLQILIKKYNEGKSIPLKESDNDNSDSNIEDYNIEYC